MTRRIILSFILVLSCLSFSQAQELPFSNIAKTPAVYNSGTISARMIEGLGFRYYWATEGLRTEDLAFKPGEDSRSAMETIVHIHGLSSFLLSAFGNEVTALNDVDKTDFKGLRKATLLNLKQAYALLMSSTDEDFENYEFPMGGGNKLPFWNAINSPIEDAVWHTGQIVMIRRVSGNPLPKGVNVLFEVKN